MTTSPAEQTFVVPEEPDWRRMRRETSARLRSAMADNGVDALILLMNDNVVYATGASGPVLDAGLSHVERRVAIVLAADEHPHLFIPFREGAASESQVPADHLHGPLYLELEEGVEHFARVIGDLIPPGANVAVDEMTGAMRRAAIGCRGGGGSGQPGQDTRPDRLPAQSHSHHRAGHGRCAKAVGAGRAEDRSVSQAGGRGIHTGRDGQHARGDL